MRGTVIEALPEGPAGTTCPRKEELARRRIGELRRLSKEIAGTTARIEDELAQSETTLTDLLGIGPILAARILGEVGDIGRIRSQAAFAMMAGAAPLVASSGMTHRHRLNQGGNRNAGPGGRNAAANAGPSQTTYANQRTGVVAVPAQALGFLADQGIQFTVIGPAPYEYVTPLRNPSTVGVQ